MGEQNQTSEATRSEETGSSLGFKPSPNPEDSSQAKTLHGLTHNEVMRVLSRGVTGSAIHHLRYVDLVGMNGAHLSGYVDATTFDAVCLALQVPA